MYNYIIHLNGEKFSVSYIWDMDILDASKLSQVEHTFSTVLKFYQRQKQKKMCSQHI